MYVTGALGRFLKHPVIISRNKSSTLLSFAYASNSSIIFRAPHVAECSACFIFSRIVFFLSQSKVQGLCVRRRAFFDAE
jgi:hypothetical protein